MIKIIKKMFLNTKKEKHHRLVKGSMTNKVITNFNGQIYVRV